MDVGENEAHGKQYPYVPNNLHPGATMFIRRDFMINFINIILPEIFDVFFEQPMNLNLDYKFIKFSKIQLGFEHLDISQIEIEFSAVHNAILLHLPDTPLFFTLDATMKIPLIDQSKTTGKLHGYLRMYKPTLAVIFEDDKYNNYFSPKLRLAMDDNFQLIPSDFQLRSVFKNLPDWLFNSIFDLFNNSIVGLIADYFKTQFMQGGSTILYYVLENNYPENVYLGVRDIFLNLLFLRKPLVTRDFITLYLTGEVYSLEQEGISSPEAYIPKGSSRSFAPNLLNSQFSNIQLSLNPPTMKKILFTFLNDAWVQIDNLILNKSGIHWLTFDVTDENLVEVKNNHFHINNMQVLFVHKRRQIIKFASRLSISFTIPFLDIMSGNIILGITRFEIDLGPIDVLVKLLSVGGFNLKELVFEYINGKPLKMEKAVVPLKPGMAVTPLEMVCSSDVISIVTGIFFNTEGKSETFFLDGLKTMTVLKRRATENVSTLTIRKRSMKILLIHIVLFNLYNIFFINQIC
jgi:hypothetical protein